LQRDGQALNALQVDLDPFAARDLASVEVDL